MTNDTLKSLGYLKKSLRMNFRAISNNSTADNIDAVELKTFLEHTKAVFDQIEAWEKASTSSGVVQPAPSVAAGVTVGTAANDANDANDLLTID